MEHYLGIPITKGIFKSPLRCDNNPTCSFYKNKKGSLLLKDFSGAFFGDCFAVVMYKFSCSYLDALKIIASDFNIITSKFQKNKALIEYSNVEFKETKPSIIQIENKSFTNEELN